MHADQPVGSASWSEQVTSQPVETTLYSLNEEPPQPCERRSDQRQLTLFRVGTILVGPRRELCLIKNISAGGMMLRIYCALRVGEQVDVELKTGVVIRGRVSWLRDSQVGVAADQPIDVVEILASDSIGPRPRMPRIETDATITVRQGAAVYRLRARDISQGGVKVEAPPRLSGNEEIVVSLAGLQPQRGMVRWVADGHAGLSFNQPLSLPELVAWLQAQRTGSRAA